VNRLKQEQKKQLLMLLRAKRTNSCLFGPDACSYLCWLPCAPSSLPFMFLTDRVLSPPLLAELINDFNAIEKGKENVRNRQPFSECPSSAYLSGAKVQSLKVPCLRTEAFPDMGSCAQNMPRGLQPTIKFLPKLQKSPCRRGLVLILHILRRAGVEAVRRDDTPRRQHSTCSLERRQPN